MHQSLNKTKVSRTPVVRLTQSLAAAGFLGVLLQAPAGAAPQDVQNPFSQVRLQGVSSQSNVNTGSVPKAPGAAGAPQKQGGVVATAGGGQAEPPAPAAGQAQAPAAPPVQSGADRGNQAQGAALPSPKIDLEQEALDRMAPATGEQVREILKELNRRQGAATTPLNPGVACKASQYKVDLSPGAQPPVVRISKGLGATVSFVDVNGNPWPITFANNFYVQAANVTQMAPHVLSVASQSDHLSGSVGVMLKDLTTPVNFIVTPAQQIADCRVSLQLPGLAPDAAPVPGAIDDRPDIGSRDLTAFLYGATPDGVTRLKVQTDARLQATTRAWQQKGTGRLVLRTDAQVVSPGWYQRLPALDGTSVYELPPASRVRVAIDGKPATIVVTGLVPPSKSAKK